MNGGRIGGKSSKTGFLAFNKTVQLNRSQFLSGLTLIWSKCHPLNPERYLTLHKCTF